MFIDELIEVLNMIPYAVWEEVLGCNVDKVNVSKEYRFGCGRDNRPQVVVFIRSGFETHIIEGLDSIDQRNEKLLCLWKPYHDLILRYIEEYNNILQKPVNYIPAIYTEKEIEIRFEQIFKYDTDSTQLVLIAGRLGLIPLLKEKYLNTKYPVLEKDVKDTAFNLIFEMIKEAISGEEAEVIITKHGISITDSDIETLNELKDYYEIVLNGVCDDDKLKMYLNKFLSQHRSIKKLHKKAEYILEDSLCDLSEKERKYCELFGLDKDLKRNVLALDSKLFDVWPDGCYYYARGYMEGGLYTLLSVMFKTYLEKGQEKKNFQSFAIEDSDLEIIWEDIQSSAQAYKEYEVIDFKDVVKDVTFTKKISTSGKEEYYCELYKYNLFVKGSDEKELLKKIEREFNWNQKKKRIKDCLFL